MDVGKVEVSWFSRETTSVPAEGTSQSISSSGNILIQEKVLIQAH